MTAPAVAVGAVGALAAQQAAAGTAAGTAAGLGGSLVPVGTGATPTLVGSSLAFYALLSALSDQAADVAGGLWDELDPAALAASWAARGLTDRMLLTTSVAQQAAAESASRYVAEAVRAQTTLQGGAELLVSKAFAGIASDGRNMDDLLRSPLLWTLGAVGAGVGAVAATKAGRTRLQTIVKTQVLDTGRAAAQTAMAAEPEVNEWVRVLVPPACSRCAVLAGKRFRTRTAFLRHPLCFPAGTVVSGPATLASTRRWYEGELTIIRTARGHELAVTANHPILTRKGWVPAHVLREGDEVVRRARGDRMRGLLVPDEHQVPTRIENVLGAGEVGAARRMPVASEDFHGDGAGSGHVDVVLAHRLLQRDRKLSLREQVREVTLALGPGAGVAFSRLRAHFKRVLADLGSASSVMSGLDSALTLFGAGAGGRDFRGPAAAATLDSSFAQMPLHRPPGQTEPFRDRLFALAREIGGDDRGSVEAEPTARWEAPTLPFSQETLTAYASIGDDLRFRLAGEVELDRVVEARGVEWQGHVYNLTSAEGWYDADGFIVSNCRCFNAPAVEDTADDLRTDPDAYFASLPADEQDRLFTKAGAEAIRNGADIGQVVNARRGAAGLEQPGRLTREEAAAIQSGRPRRLDRVDVYGRPLATTTEGTTRRGLAGQRLIAEAGSKRGERSKYRRSRTPRLMPEAILEIAGNDTEQQVALLRRFGYLL